LLNESNWCPEVYRSIFIDKFNDDQIKIAPCCQSIPAIESVVDFDFKTSKHLQKIRQEFDQGNKPSQCVRCWSAEKVGQKSRRQSAIEFFNMTTPDPSIVLESIDYNSTWACNLACIMCGPSFSSTWATELKLSTVELKQLGRKFRKSNKIQNALDLSEIKKIHFNGGEPLLNNDQFDLLDNLDLSNTTISYNTNGTICPSDRLIDIWNRAKLVKLFFSVDAIGPQFEYIRYPAKWSQVEQNLIRMRQEMPSNVMFGFNSTVGCYNAFEMVDVWKWFNENLLTNRESDPSDFCWQLAYNYDIADLSEAAKQDIINHTETIPELSSIANYTRSTLDKIANTHWQSKLDQIDQRRGTDWKKSLKIGKYY